MKKTYLFPLLVAIATLPAVALLREESFHMQEKESASAIARSVAQQWTVTPTGIGKPFRDVQFLDENNGWAVTDHGLWKTTDGRNWSELKTAPSVKVLTHYNPQETLEMVQFLNQTEGWLLEGDYLVHTTDAGASWRKHEFKNLIVRSFRFLNTYLGWFVGERLHLPNGGDEAETSNPVIYATEDGGKEWHCVFSGAASPYPLWDVWPISAKSIWAVGTSILRSDDGGKTWERIHIKDRNGVSGMPISIQFLDSTIGWIITNEPGGYLFTADGGNSWEPRPFAQSPSGLTDLVYLSSVEAWAVGKGIYLSSDSGRSWTKVLDGDYSEIQYLKDRQILFAAGKNIALCKRS